MVQIQEASRSDLMVRMIAAAARDHGPAVFIVGRSIEDAVIVDAIVRHRIPVALATVGEDANALRVAIERLYDLDAGRTRVAESLDRALFGQNARITARRGSAGNPIPAYEYDAAHGVLRFNPLSGWNDADLRRYVDVQGIAAFERCPRDYASLPEMERVAA